MPDARAPQAASGTTPWTAVVLTLFPEMFPGPLGQSLAGKASQAGLWALEVMDIRGFARDKHRSVDDVPFGGGAGMVLRPDVADAAIDAALARAPKGSRAVYLSPRGRRFDQAMADELAAGPGTVLLCGRYEGLDQRVIEARALEEVSLGDFVLSGGEPAALAMLDACVRLLPGVMGADASRDEESFRDGLLEYPHYTRPAVWRGRAVPEVLLSGHHANIAAWRRQQSEQMTAARRPDLWAQRAVRACVRRDAPGVRGDQP